MFRPEAIAAEPVVASCQPDAKTGGHAAERENSSFFVLFPGFSLLTLSAFLEPLKLANQALNRTAYRWRLISYEGRPVQGCVAKFFLGRGGWPDGGRYHAARMVNCSAREGFGLKAYLACRLRII